jgi:hypothetical protein
MKAVHFRKSVRSGESIFCEGRVLAAHEYILAAALGIGRNPPPIPGSWAKPNLRLSGSVADLHAERKLMNRILLPALRSSLLSNRVLLGWEDPGFCGPRQAPNTEAALALHLRLRSLDTCGSAKTCLASGDSILLFCAFLTGRTGQAPMPNIAVLPRSSDKLLRVRVWTGDVAETGGHSRVPGWERHEVSAEISIHPGVYEPRELVKCLQYALNSADWAVSTVSENKSTLFKWEWNIINDRLHVQLFGKSFYSFELQFREPGLDAMLGFAVDQSLSGAVIRSGMPERRGAGTAARDSDGLVWISETIAAFPLVTAEERKALETKHKILTEPAWKQLVNLGENSVIEMLRGCLLRPRGAEAVILRRSAAFLSEGRFAAARLSGAVSKSLVAVFEAQSGSPEEKTASSLESMLARLGAIQDIYHVQYENFKYCTDTVIERVKSLYPEAVAAMSVATSKIADHEYHKASHDDLAYGNSLMEVNDAVIRAARFRRECLGWWQLAADEWAERCRGCPHGVLGELCKEQSCEELRRVACNTILCEWATRKVSASQDGFGEDCIGQDEAHIEARAARLDLGLESLGRLALARLYDCVQAYSPCKILTNPDSLVTDSQARGVTTIEDDSISYNRVAAARTSPDTIGPEGSLFNSHILARARQVRMSEALAADFCRPHGQTRDRALVELDRMTSGPPSSRPPVVILSGPAHSGRTATLATFSRIAARPAKARIATQRRPADALPFLRGTGSAGAAEVVAIYMVDPLPSLVESGDEREHIDLRMAMDYLITEIDLQLEGCQALNRDIDVAAFTRSLLCTNAEDLLKDAEARLAAACRSAIKTGTRILLLVDGLSPASILRLSKIALSIHGEAVRARCLIQRNRKVRYDENDNAAAEGCGGIQLILTGEASPVELRSDVRNVSLEPLSNLERETICWHWLHRFGFEIPHDTLAGGIRCASDFDQTLVAAAIAATSSAAHLRGISPPMNNRKKGIDFSTDKNSDVESAALKAAVRVIIGKSDAHLPLFLAAFANQVSRWVLCDPESAYRPLQTSSGIAAALERVSMRIFTAPDTLLDLWQNSVLAYSEQRWGRETVRWIVLHLAAHPEGLPFDDLRDFARASMGTLLRIHHQATNKYLDVHGTKNITAATDRGSRHDSIEKFGTSVMDQNDLGKLVIQASRDLNTGEAMLLDAETLELLVGVPESGPEKHDRSISASARACESKSFEEGQAEIPVGKTSPIPGVVWCSDAELAALLDMLQPFFRPTISACTGDCSEEDGGRRLAFAHNVLTTVALCRYDRMNSTAQKRNEAKRFAFSNEEEDEGSLPFRR